jgi:Tfp pilus assembly protein PilF
MALDTQNVPMQSQAIDALIGTGNATAAELPALMQSQAVLALNAGKRDRAEAIYARLVEMQPDNAEALADFAKLKNDLRKPGEAAALLDRAAAVREAAGQRPPESWYQYGLRLSVDNKMTAPGARFSRGLIAAYPSPENWRDAMLAYFDLHPADPAAIDAWRLMRAARGLGGERDYLQFAQAANSAGLAAEAKAVLDEGVARKMVDPAKASFRELTLAASKRAAADRAGRGARETAALAAATGTPAMDAADAAFGYGDYAKAAALYGAAIQKGGVDGGIANIRLGAALALAGQRAEAETAFRSVTGPGSDLAALWLVWLRQPV